MASGFALQINLDQASAATYVNQSPPWYLNITKGVTIGGTSVNATKTSWVCQPVLGATINIGWTASYNLFYSTSAIQNGASVSQTTSAPAVAGSSYAFNGTTFSPNGVSTIPGAIEVVNNVTNQTPLMTFGISQSYTSTGTVTPPVSLAVTSTPNNGGVTDFTPLQFCTMWMSQSSSSPSVIISTTGPNISTTVVSGATSQMSMVNGTWQAGALPSQNVVTGQYIPRQPVSYKRSFYIDFGTRVEPAAFHQFLTSRLSRKNVAAMMGSSTTFDIETKSKTPNVLILRVTSKSLTKDQNFEDAINSMVNRSITQNWWIHQDNELIACSKKTKINAVKEITAFRSKDLLWNATAELTVSIMGNNQSSGDVTPKRRPQSSTQYAIQPPKQQQIPNESDDDDY